MQSLALEVVWTSAHIKYIFALHKIVLFKKMTWSLLLFIESTVSHAFKLYDKKISNKRN